MVPPAPSVPLPHTLLTDTETALADLLEELRDWNGGGLRGMRRQTRLRYDFAETVLTRLRHLREREE